MKQTFNDLLVRKKKFIGYNFLMEKFSQNPNFEFVQ